MNAALELFVKGGPLMWPLLVCSMVSVALSLERTVFWARRGHPSVGDLALAGLRRGDIEAARAAASGSRDPVARLVAAALSGPGPAVLLEAASAILAEHRRGLRVLDSIITVAPLLGILGTVTGIIDSFQLLGSVVRADPAAVSEGIAVALITTAFGLAVAIASLLPYNIFLGLLEDATGRLERAGTELESLTAGTST